MFLFSYFFFFCSFFFAKWQMLNEMSFFVFIRTKFQTILSVKGASGITSAARINQFNSLTNLINISCKFVCLLLRENYYLMWNYHKSESILQLSDKKILPPVAFDALQTLSIAARPATTGTTAKYENFKTFNVDLRCNASVSVHKHYLLFCRLTTSVLQKIYFQVSEFFIQITKLERAKNKNNENKLIIRE